MDENYQPFLSKIREDLEVLFNSYFCNRTLLVTIHSAIWPITQDTLHQVFSPYGFLEKIIPSQNSVGVQFLVQFQGYGAVAAKISLHGRNIYDGCCQLDIQFWDDPKVSDVVDLKLENQLKGLDDLEVFDKRVERDQDGEDFVVKDGAMMEDDSMGINESLYVLQASPKIKAELEGDVISVTELSTSPLTLSSAPVVETTAEPVEASTVNTLKVDGVSDIRVFEEMSMRADKQVIGQVIHIIREFDLQRERTLVIDSSKLFGTVDILPTIMVEVRQINYPYRVLIRNFVIQRAPCLVMNCLWLCIPFDDDSFLSRIIVVDDLYRFRLLLMDEGDIFGIITLDRERARSITIAKTIVVMRKRPLKSKGIHISGYTTKVSTLPASTRILESTKKDKEGVASAITPWNFPLTVITRKVGSAFTCGCTVIVKPSELTPLTALAAVELSLQAGIPPGVLNMVMRNASDIGDALLASPQVRKIIYTGSTTVGKRLMKGAVGTVRSILLELGGNAPCIVFDDADLDVAVKGVLAAKFCNSGHTCVCANRVIVQEGIYKRFDVVFSKAVKNLQVGDGFIEGVVHGQLINEVVVQKVESFLQDALSKGAKVILGGKRHSLGMTFYEPTIVTDVKTDMLLAREEVFGPVAPLLRFKTEEEAIRIANDTNAGLAAYIFTSNVQRTWRVSEALEYGLVGVNEGIISTEVAPFGGVKQSGLGREGSKYGIDEYLELKYVCLGDMNRK